MARSGSGPGRDCRWPGSGETPISAVSGGPVASVIAVDMRLLNQVAVHARTEEGIVKPMAEVEGHGLPSAVVATEGSPRRTTFLDKVAKKAFFRQLLMNGSVILLFTGSGMPIAFSAVLMPQLEAANSTIPTDQYWSSFITSVHSVVSPMGAVLAGPLMDRVGRRFTLQLAVVPLITSWLLISIANSHAILIMGRLLAGFAVGMSPGPSQVLISEVSEPRLRGVFGSGPNIAYTLGILLVYGLSLVLPWQLVAASASLVPIVGLLLLFFLPESPVWLVNRGYADDARKSLLWLRGGDHEKVNQELHTLVAHHKAEEDRQMAKEMSDDASCQLLPEKFTCLSCPEVYKPLFIILTFCLLQILTGPYIVIFYGVSFISRATDRKETDFQNLTIGAMVAGVRFLVSIIATISLFRMGRRKIGMISGFGTAITCFSLFGYRKLKKHGIIEISEEWNTPIVVTLIMLYVAFNTYGIFSLPCLMIGEVLPARVRGFVSGIFFMVINLMIFSTSLLYKPIASVLGAGEFFLLFGIVATIATLYIYLILPETKDRPLTQIERYFSIGKNYLWMTRDKTLMARQKSNNNNPIL